MVETRIVETATHGRYIVRKGKSQRTLVGFHGYAENAEKHLAELVKFVDESWTMASVQALNRFYNRAEETVACWMTSQDREVAIADNLKYVRRIVDELRPFDKLVFFGFSQGAAMAYRAAKDIGCDGLIVLGGDLPPDVTHFDAPLFLARGERDEWYSADKFEKDLKYLTERVSLTSLVFDGGHEFSDAFRENAAAFLRSL